ncbi:hypothetical protein [Pedobacter sp. KBW06]|uniref:hypothetical protein n=1 Tax=Pedobacter sp. KBW06 TaxID=2153359 RepID=UPI000F597DEF|nr:hypothetical protein [Pedobacter sp. KBW06]
MKKTFKIIQLDPKELRHEAGNFPIQSQVPFGPRFNTKQEAEDWLAKKLNINKSYMILEIYSL